MKRLSKIRLINWHLYNDVTIPVEGNVVLTGVNGSGKTTLLDALLYVISGSSIKKFNTAAGFKGNRTVEKYIKGETGKEGQESLRGKQDIYAHIALQFYDEATRSPLTIAVAFFLPQNGSLQSDFYGYDAPIDDDLFFGVEQGKKVYRSFKDIDKEARLRQISGYQSLEGVNHTKEQRIDNVKRFLNLPENYLDLLQKAMSPEKLLDIDSFAKDFILPEDKIQIEPIRDAGKNYQELHAKFLEDERRIEILKPLATESETYDKAQEDNRYLSVLTNMADEEIQSDLIASNEAKKKALEIEIEDASRKIDSLDEGIRQDTIDLHSLENNEARQAYNEAKRKLEEAQANAKRAEADFQKAQGRVNALEQSYRPFAVQLSLTNAISNRDENAFSLELAKVSSEYERIRSDADRQVTEATLQYNENVKNVQSLQEKVNSLSKNVKPFPKEAKDLEKAVEAEYGKSRIFHRYSAGHLCDLINIAPENEKWRPILESLLGERRFDLLTNGYDGATRVFSFAKRGTYGGQGVVRVDSLASVESSPDSLATKIDCTATYEDGKRFELKEARQYVDALLGNIRIVPEITKDIDFPAITEKGAYFDGHRLSQVPILQGEYFIGKEAIRIELERARKSLEIEQAKTPELRRAKAKAEAYQRAAFNLSKGEALADMPGLWKTFDQSKEAVLQAQSRVQAMQEADADLVGLEEKIQELKAKISQKNAEKGSLSRENDRRNGDLGKLENQIEEASKKRDEAHALAMEGLREIENPLKEERIAGLKQDMRAVTLKSVTNRKMAENLRRIETAKRTIENQIRLYNDTFHLSDFASDVSNKDHFVEIYNSLNGERIKQDEVRSEGARKEMEQALQMSFINELRAKILDSDRVIKEMNRSLKDTPFGAKGEVYSFKASKNKDERYADLYDIVSDPNKDTSSESLFSTNLTEKDERAMATLLDHFSRDIKTEEDQKVIDEYCDYRNYRTYDIQIDNQSDGSRKMYSKTAGGSSGGENQTPFYALIAGAFAAEFQKEENPRLGKSPCGVVIFDEAFNNMDSSRIESMMAYYRKLNIQLIVAVPTSRFSYLQRYADTCLALVSRDENIVIKTEKKEKTDAAL